MDMQQQQQQQGKQNTGGQRPLSILPSSLQAVQAANIRAASSVSTQTVHGVQATVHIQVTIVGLIMIGRTISIAAIRNPFFVFV